MKRSFNIPAAYRLVKQQTLTEVDSEGYLLEHVKTGARVALLANEDDNKVFTIGFRTPPIDDCGTPHIMEHSVLCGSKNFPVKDPFLELMKGSLNTFLNAMTYSDKTVYPVASCNDQDFKNLMHVYMDAVLYPNVYEREEIFRQEGWSYELESVDAPLIYNGVVYNEMKGAFSSPDDVLAREMQHVLFPDTPYGFESGGDPDHIPELTYEKFLALHSRFYHPSNSYIYLYGDMDMEERLIWLDEEYLSKFDRIQVDSQIPEQPAFAAMKTDTVEYPISEGESEEDNTYLCWSAVVGESTDEKLYLAFQALSQALFSVPGAPVKTALVKAGIGKDVYGEYDNSIRQTVMSVTAKNANAEDADRFLAVIRESLAKCVEEGIDKDTLRGVVNSMEFHFREADFGRFPKGLMYGLTMFDSWLYDDAKPFVHLTCDESFAFLKEMIDTDYYEMLVQKYLLENPHSALVKAVPKQGLQAQRDEALAAKLAAYKATLSEEEVEALVQRTASLKQYKAEPSAQEDLEKIPLLKISDIKKEPEPILLDEKEIAGVKALHTNIFTNRIGYFMLSFDATGVTEEELPYVGFLKTVIGLMDTEHYSYADLTNLLGIHTGGIFTELAFYEKAGQSAADTPEFRFDLRGKTLYEKTDFAFALSEEMLLHTDFSDDARMLEVLREAKSHMESSLSFNGNSYAVGRASAYASKTADMKEKTGGIAFYEWLADTEEHFEERKGSLRAELEALVKKLVRKENLILAYTGNDEGYEKFEAAAGSFAEKLTGMKTEQKSKCSACADGDEIAMEENVQAKEASAKCLESNDSAVIMRDTEEQGKEPGEKPSDSVPVREAVFTPNRRNEAFKTSAQIQYCTQSGYFNEAGFEYDGGLQVLSSVLSIEYLWNEIRVLGGAYGCGASFSRNGRAIFHTYRDPNLERSYDVFAKIPEFIRHFDVSERDMTKYIIGTISNMDTPLTPSGKGSRSTDCYFSGLTWDMLAKAREEVLSADVEKIRSYADLLEAVLKQNYVCVIGNEGRIEASEGLFLEKKPLFR
ncbi:MAG: insulinase family protein [Lachnospiraceae bacterium]|nr:insulinase family protein [Lachnospiraceae bacterium]